MSIAQLYKFSIPFTHLSGRPKTSSKMYSTILVVHVSDEGGCTEAAASPTKPDEGDSAGGRGSTAVTGRHGSQPQGEREKGATIYLT